MKKALNESVMSMKPFFKSDLALFIANRIIKFHHERLNTEMQSLRKLKCLFSTVKLCTLLTVSE